MKVQPLKNGVFFQFADKTRNGLIEDVTESGIILNAQIDKRGQQKSRWAVVTHIGPDVNEIEPGDHVFIESLKWTTGFQIDGETHWKTDEQQVMVVSKEPVYQY